MRFVVLSADSPKQETHAPETHPTLRVRTCRQRSAALARWERSAVPATRKSPEQKTTVKSRRVSRRTAKYPEAFAEGESSPPSGRFQKGESTGEAARRWMRSSIAELRPKAQTRPRTSPLAPLQQPARNKPARFSHNLLESRCT